MARSHGFDENEINTLEGLCNDLMNPDPVVSVKKSEPYATYKWLRQLYAMWPNQTLKDFLSKNGEF